MKRLVEEFTEDVNKEDGVILQFFTGVTNRLFHVIIALSIPLFLYLFWKLYQLTLY